MAAMIRAGGIEFDVDAFLSSSPLRPTAVFRKGEPRSAWKPDGARNERSHLNLEASAAEFDEYGRQIEEAAEFLFANREEMLRLMNFPGVEGVHLDFGVVWRDVPAHSDVLPAKLVRLAGELGLSIEISHYPIGDNEST